MLQQLRGTERENESIEQRGKWMPGVRQKNIVDVNTAPVGDGPNNAVVVTDAETR
jgi:hypothetical protein